MANNFLLNLPKRTTKVILNHIQRNNVVNVPPTATGKRRFRLPVETDPHLLVNYCCGLNYHIDEPLVPLKPDNEYPDWLWQLRLGPKPNSWELEKGTKEYYLKLAEEGRDRNRIISLKSAKPTKVVGKTLLSQAEYLHHIRFAALAHMEEENDAGYQSNMTRAEFLDQFESSRAIKARDYYLPVDETREVYKDQIDSVGMKGTSIKYADKTSTFARRHLLDSNRKVERVPIQDSKRRHPYSIM